MGSLSELYILHRRAFAGVQSKKYLDIFVAVETLAHLRMGFFLHATFLCDTTDPTVWRVAV